jgi:hypothetical protein
MGRAVKPKAAVAHKAASTASYAPPKKTVRKKAGSYILAPAKGPTNVSHRRIKKAVEKVFRERSAADA